MFRKMYNIVDLKSKGKVRDFFQAFNMSLASWTTRKEVLGSILISSLMIDILNLALPMALLQVYDRIIPNVAYNTLFWLVIGVIIALVIEALLRIARFYVGAWADAKFEHVTGCKAFTHLLYCPLKNYEREGAGVHIKRMNSLNMLRDFYAGQFLISLADIPFIILMLGLIILVGHWLVVVPIIMLIIFFTVSMHYAKIMQYLLQQRKKQEDRQLNFLIEIFTNMHTVKGSTLEAQMLRRYERLQRINAVNDYKISLNSSLLSSKSLVFSQLTIVFVVAAGSVFVMNGLMTIGGLAACTILAGRIMQPIYTIVGVWSRMKTINIARDDLQQILDYPLESKSDQPKLPSLQGEIELKNVSFKLEDSAENILLKVNLKVAAKEIIAIKAGQSLAPSMMLWLMMGMFKPEKGEILCDGQNIKDFNVVSLRKQIAYMSQQSVLFSGTIMENLTMFRVDEYYERGLEVAELLDIARVIESLPDGYDTKIETMVAEALPNGINQRIAIGRALIEDPPIILFDQANNALDMQSDIALLNVMEKLIGERTIIMVSERPSYLKLAHKQYKFQNGVLGVVA